MEIELSHGVDEFLVTLEEGLLRSPAFRIYLHLPERSTKKSQKEWCNWRKNGKKQRLDN